MVPGHREGMTTARLPSKLVPVLTLGVLLTFATNRALAEDTAPAAENVRAESPADAAPSTSAPLAQASEISARFESDNEPRVETDRARARVETDRTREFSYLAEVVDDDVGSDAVRPRRNWGLVVSGAAMLAASWAANIGGSLLWTLWPGVWGIDNTPYVGWSFVPLVGPAMQLTTPSSEPWQAVLAVLVTAVQATGLTMAVVGTVSSHSSEQDIDIAIAPVFGEGFAGLALGGRI